MKTILKPCKEEIRAWLVQRWLHRQPLPEREQILRDLGWRVVREERSLPGLALALSQDDQSMPQRRDRAR